MKNDIRRIFAMNNPEATLTTEIPFLLSCGVDGVELTIEPPGSYIPQIAEAWNLLQSHCTIVHTRDDLRFASSDPKDRDIWMEAMLASFDISQKLGLQRINVHPDRGPIDLSSNEVFRLNVKALSELAKIASSYGLELMVENQPPFTSWKQIRDVINAAGRDLFVLLDVAHAYCYGSAAETAHFIQELGTRIRHVHISDNRGERDEHLFPGYGNIDLAALMPLLHRHVAPDVALSLESFRIIDGSSLRIVTEAERGPLVSAAIRLLREIQ